jgi:hypothetical protein
LVTPRSLGPKGPYHDGSAIGKRKPPRVAGLVSTADRREWRIQRKAILSKIKRRLGSLATAVVLGTGGSVMAAGAASAEPVSAMSWVPVQSYEHTPAGWAQCNADGRSYADGSTGYECRTVIGDTGAEWYVLFVGP